MIKFHQMIIFNETAVFYKNGALDQIETSSIARKKVRGETMITKTSHYTIDPNSDMAVNLSFPPTFTEIAENLLTEINIRTY